MKYVEEEQSKLRPRRPKQGRGKFSVECRHERYCKMGEWYVWRWYLTEARRDVALAGFQRKYAYLKWEFRAAS